MKSFKQYITEEVLTESISAIADDIKDTLVNSANTMSFDPADMEKHRLLGTHNDLLKGKGPRSEIKVRKGDSGNEHETIYNFDFGHPDTNVRLKITHWPSNPKTPYEVKFTFADKYSKNTYIGPEQRSMLMPHVYEGVMKGLAHFTIENRVNPDQYGFDAFGIDEPKVLPSGKERKTSEMGQKRRIYGHIGTALKAIMPNSSK